MCAPALGQLRAVRGPGRGEWAPQVRSVPVRNRHVSCKAHTCVVTVLVGSPSSCVTRGQSAMSGPRQG
eukprot:scaffold742_cov395-Prasinococcus_capsulatus_cf.AAC.28